ncbi:MAG: hypothetical protein E6H92_10035 [Chloroflexi bacterium]|nr:MAG: hypothetical protein E6H92_10035 [Chloroflexota bacterium]
MLNYGCDPAQFDAMLAAQGGLCAICRGPQTVRWRSRLKQLAVDHDHQTGHIRGLLCDACNHGLGSFRNDTSLLRSAIDYLNANTIMPAVHRDVLIRKRNPDHWAKSLKPCIICARQVELTSWGKYCSTACKAKARYARQKKISSLTLAEGTIPYRAGPYNLLLSQAHPAA